MEEWNHPPSVCRQIGTLLGTLLVSVVGAFLLVSYFLYNYGPTGQYRVADILLEPKLVSQLSFVVRDTRRGNKKEEPFMDEIVLRYYYEGKQRWEESRLSVDQYATMYRWIQEDKSLKNIDQAVFDAFLPKNLEILELRARSVSSSISSSNKPFQEVILAPEEGYYKIRLLSPGETGDYAYFQQSGLFEKVRSLVIE